MSARTGTPSRAGPPPQKRQRLDSFTNPQPRPLSSLSKNSKGKQSGPPPTARQCPNPSCHDKNVGEEEGQIICRGCGTVISESNIVAEVQFAETSSGGHLMLGQHVGSDQAHAKGTLRALRNGSGLTSREATESNGRRWIHQLGAALGVPHFLIDSGMNVFRLAAANNFIQGRHTRHVSAVSLYIASRVHQDSGQKYMLIDFSDILQLNVFRLGQIYKDLIEELRINGNSLQIKPINPENLLYRFSERLEFGRDRDAVAMDGVRILQRMNRDWMTPGRRPAGVCGAALIIAARMHNYRRSVREMVYVAKVGEATLMKRLEEFTKTESSGLTVEEFRKIDLERFCDPPAFYEQNSGRSQRRRKRKLVEIDDDGDTDIESQRAISVPSSAANVQLETTANIEGPTQPHSQSMPPPPLPSDSTPTKSQPSNKRKRGRPPKSRPPGVQAQASTLPPSTEIPIDPNITTAMSDPSSLAHASALSQIIDTGATPATPPPTQQDQTHPRTPVLSTEEISDSEFGIDAELTECLLTPTEVEIKTRIWTHENREWIRTQHAKELRQKLAEENGMVPKVKRRIRRRTRMGNMDSYRREGGDDGQDGEDEEGAGDEGGRVARSAAEAVEKMMKKRAYSKKINYDTLTKLYEPSPGSSSSGSRRESASAATAAAASPGAGDIFASPRATPAVQAQSPSNDSRTGGAEEATPSGSRHRDTTERASPTAADDIETIAREEAEERSMVVPGAPTKPSEDVDGDDEEEEEEEEGEEDDYFSEEDDNEEDSIEGILKAAREKSQADDDGGGDDDDDEYDYD